MLTESVRTCIVNHLPTFDRRRGNRGVWARGPGAGDCGRRPGAARRWGGAGERFAKKLALRMDATLAVRQTHLPSPVFRPTPSSGWISDVMDTMVRTRALQHFLATGTLVSQGPTSRAFVCLPACLRLLPPPPPPPSPSHTLPALLLLLIEPPRVSTPTHRLAGRVKDEEYLGGATGLSQDLQRWVSCSSDVCLWTLTDCAGRRGLLSYPPRPLPPNTIMKTSQTKMTTPPLHSTPLRQVGDPAGGAAGRGERGPLPRPPDGAQRQAAGVRLPQRGPAAQVRRHLKWGVRRMEDLLYELSVVGLAPGWRRRRGCGGGGGGQHRPAGGAGGDPTAPRAVRRDAGGGDQG